MKWVTILSFVVVLSLTESRILQKTAHQEGHHDGQEHHEGHHDGQHDGQEHHEGHPKGHHDGQEHHEGHPEQQHDGQEHHEVHPEGHHDGQEHHEVHPEGHHDGHEHHEGHPEGHHGGHNADSHLIGDAFKLLGKEHFEAVAMVVFSQNLQKCPFDEHVQRVKDVKEIAERCSKGIKTAECGKSVATVFVDEMCKKPENVEKYTHHADCCAKAENERHACFVSHKPTAPDALPPYQKKDPEQTCKEFHHDQKTFMGNYIYEMAHRYTLMHAPAILYFSHRFEEIISECCKDIAHCATCFDEKKPPLKEEMKISYAKQRHSCYVLEEFGESVLMALKLSRMSQKLPKASFQNVVDIAHDMVHLTKPCCSAYMVECMVEKMALNNKACEKKDKLSSKVKECCEKDIIEQSECIVKMKLDEKPADLSPDVREFIENPNVCRKYKDEKDQFLAK